jgi:predicted Fe-Mo cluster-binding NifX family protein
LKIVITSTGNSLESPVDPRFGRAAYFIVYDLETGKHVTHDNLQNLNAAQGAGIQAAQTVAKLGAEWLLTGHCGPKAFQVLSSAGIQIAVGIEGTVAEAIENFKEGKHQATDSPDVDGHWV